MRTTLTLDDDVSALLDRVQGFARITFKQAVNDALRRGLQQMLQPDRLRTLTYTRPVDLGNALVENLADTAALLRIAEGEDFK